MRDVRRALPAETLAEDEPRAASVRIDGVKFARGDRRFELTEALADRVHHAMCCDPPEFGELAVRTRAQVDALHVGKPDQRKNRLAVDDRARGKVITLGRNLDVAELLVFRKIGEWNLRGRRQDTEEHKNNRQDRSTWTHSFFPPRSGLRRLYSCTVGRTAESASLHRATA